MGSMKFKQKDKMQELEEKWKVLIVDDEQSVHTITVAVLENIVFDNKKIEFISAYSGAQAKEIMTKESDIALVLLDVVMENDSAGLQFVDFVRDELKNRFVRIVLRTGQPGHAPQKEVIDEYDINDYKEKTELTAQKLYTTVISSLRNYRDLKQLESEKVAIETPSCNRAIYEFSKSSLNKLLETINTNLQDCEAMVVGIIKKEKVVLASTSQFEEFSYNEIIQTNPEIIETIEKAIKTKSSLHFENAIVNYYEDESKNENVIYLSCGKTLSQNEVQMLEMFAFNLASAIELYYK